MKIALVLLALAPLLACGRSKSGEGDGNPAAGLTPLLLPPSCESDTETPPRTLVCSGLYADLANKVIAPGVSPYAPAVALWSDGADKLRWIHLPAGGVIDNSDPGEWKFPDGTKAWKEFSREGRRVETRLWQKVHDNYWVDATYAWNVDESEAIRSAGGDITLEDGSPYHIPTQDECEKCHRGRSDRLLGFEQVLLGLEGATGLTLDTLVNQGRLSEPPASTTLQIGDDGTGAAAPAMGWMHVNCGTTCHNQNSGSSGYAAGMLLRLDPNLLDGGPTSDFDFVKTTVGVTVGTPNWSGQIRIVPGTPDQSLIYRLISQRGEGLQMPPIATSVVDPTGVALVAAWIAALPAPVSSPLLDD